MLIEICQKRGVSPRLVRELLLIESTPPRHGKRGVNVRSREAIEAFAQDPAQLNERISPKGQLPTQLASGPTVWLEEIELKNFAQFEDAGAKFAFNPDRPICLIEANNGHGKSTLIQAVLYVLYGISRARASELVHHSVKGPRARVEVRLRLRLEGEGEVMITRFSNFERSGHGWSQEESSLTVVSQQGEGEVLHDDIAQDWVKMYLPQEVFSFFCFDAENSPVNSLAEGSAGANIAEALEAVLGITAIRTTAERCRKLGKDWDKEIAANFSHRTPKEVKARQAELEAKKESNEKELEGLKQELQRAIERGARIDSHLESLLHSFDPEQEIERQTSLARLEMVHEQLEVQAKRSAPRRHQA